MKLFRVLDLLMLLQWHEAIFKGIVHLKIKVKVDSLFLSSAEHYRALNYDINE